VNKKAQKKSEETGKKRFRLLLDYWIKHNQEHASELEKWLQQLEAEGWEASAQELQEAIKLAAKMNRHIEGALNKLSNRKEGKHISSPPAAKEILSNFNLKKIGTIHTPYKNFAPYQPRENDEGEFIIEVDPDYETGLNRLEEFRYIYVLYYLHQRRGPISLKVQSPWSEEEVGLFASRSSHRPNPIGLSVVKIIKRQENKLFTSGLDVFDGTSLLDLKPYLQELDAKADADYGWLNGSESRDHLLLHIKGIPH